MEASTGHPVDHTESEDISEQKATKQAAKVKNKTKMLDQETVEKAAERATEAASNLVLASVPKTSAGFEKDFKQLKKNTAHVYQYLNNIPLKTLESLFRLSEVQAEVFTGVLQALALHGLAKADSCQRTAEFLLSLSKAANFDMTLMFADDAEKKDVATITAAIKRLCPGGDLLQRFNKVYGNL